MKITEEVKSRWQRYVILPFLVTILTLLTLGQAGRSEAAGLLIADGGFGGVLEIKEHDVHVTINNGVAVTKITEIFHNTENRQVEALYTFPVPKNASVANFSMWINNKEVIGEVLEKKRAREIYNSYKSVRRDPGLLEQVDYKRFEMRIFPIAAGADQKVEITYYQELDVDHDEVSYVYPLATVTRGELTSKTTGRFSFQMDARSAIPISGLTSPSHGDEFVMASQSDSYVVASLEQKGGSLARDIVLHYDLKRPTSGMDLITSKTEGEDGYFYLTVTAGQELTEENQGMDYVFLLDISGSMANSNKLSVSNNSLNAFIDELGSEDRFEVMSFNVQPNTLFNKLATVEEQNQVRARDFLNSQRAKGGTVLAPALNTAYKYGEADRPLNVVILSDGMTEQKERQQLIQLIGQRPENTRVFCIGIGNEINRPLLEQMAENSGGLAAFISGSDNFQRQARALRRKLMRPAASNLAINFEGLEVYDLVPGKLPNLYYGSPVKLYGRYKDSGDASIILTGQVMGQEISQQVSLPFPKQDSANPEIERMWAQKKINQLLKQENRGGGQGAVIDEVIQLGEDYSIVTEYTSFLVLENDAEYKRWKIERRNQKRITRDRSAQRQRLESLSSIRNKALQGLGPQEEKKAQEQLQATPQATKPGVSRSQPAPQVTNTRSQSRDMNFGSGPVGPLFVGLGLWMRRRKKATRISS